MSESFTRLRKKMSKAAQEAAVEKTQAILETMPFPQFTEKYLEVDHLKVRYIDEGEGPVLFLVHGILASLEFWAFVIPELSKHFRVIAIDNLGFGKTDGITGDYTLARYTKFLSRVMDELQIKKCYLAGHSLGGVITLRLALDEPERIEKLMLMDAVGFDTQVAFLFRVMKFWPFGKLLTCISKSMYKKGMSAHVFHPECLTPEFIDAAHPLVQNLKVRNTTLSIVKHHTSFSGIKLSVLKPQWDDMARLKNTPVLILWGRNDGVLKIHHADAARKFLPHAQIEIFEECGHLPLIEYPQKTADLMIRFFEGNK